MRLNSNLNPKANKQSKPNIRKAFCINCSYKDEVSRMVDTIDLVCLKCRAEGYTLEKALEDSRRVSKIEADNTDKERFSSDLSGFRDGFCQNKACGVELSSLRKKFCDDCTKISIKNSKTRNAERARQAKIKGFRRCKRCDIKVGERKQYCTKCREVVEALKRVENYVKRKKSLKRCFNCLNTIRDKESDLCGGCKKYQEISGKVLTKK